MNKGYGKIRYNLMYNDFVLVGPVEELIGTPLDQAEQRQEIDKLSPRTYIQGVQEKQKDQVKIYSQEYINRFNKFCCKHWVRM